MLREKIVDALAKVIDPEIGMDIVTLGLIYKIQTDDDNNVNINMTLTFPGCPLAKMLVEQAKNSVQEIENIGHVNINLIFEPKWDQTLVSESNIDKLKKQDKNEE